MPRFVHDSSGFDDGLLSESEDKELSVRRFGHPVEDALDKHLCLVKPILDAKSIVDGWKRHQLIFHLQVGIRPSLTGAEECNFCADLEYRAPGSGSTSEHAVPIVNDFVVETMGQPEDWLNKSVLIRIVEVRQDLDRVKRAIPLPVSVRLCRTDQCDVPAAHPRKFRRALLGGLQAPVEASARRRNRKRNGALFGRRQRARWLVATTDERPREVVETAPIMVGHSAESQHQPRRSANDPLNCEREAVTLRVVVTPHGKQVLKARVSCEGTQLLLQSFAFSYRPAPLEPGAIEQSLHGGEFTTPRLFRQTLLAALDEALS